VTVLSCHTSPSDLYAQILSGGLTSYDSHDSTGRSPTLASSSTSPPSLTPALASASRSPWETTGVRGDSYQAGKPKEESATLVGQKQWASSSSPSASPALEVWTRAIDFSVTTPASWRGGETGAAETAVSTRSSSRYSSTSIEPGIPSVSTLHTFPAPAILQTGPLEEYTRRVLCSFPQSRFPSDSTVSSSTQSNPPPHTRSDYSVKESTQPQLPSPLTTYWDALAPSNSVRPTRFLTGTSATTAVGTSQITSHFDGLIPLSSSISAQRGRPYPPALTPQASELRPHCLARDRLQVWKPLIARSAHDQNDQEVGNIAQLDLDRILEAIVSSYASGTREAYGAGLLAFHVLFIASCTGIYAGATVRNYIAGVHAWHTLHGLQWTVDDSELKALLKGADRRAPPASKRPKRRPVLMTFLTAAKGQLNLSEPLDAAVWACLTTVFFAAARLGEFTLPSLKAFREALHVKPSNVRRDRDRQGREVTVIHLPSTKVAPLEGEDVYWAAQLGPVDPEEALANHMRINNPDAGGHLFAWKHRDGPRALTKSAFLKRMDEVAKSVGEEPMKGHGLRIGATLEYLLRGVPFDVVKSIRRWSGESFTLYLRKHAVIIAPYLQSSPILDDFTRYTMPPQPPRR